MSKHKSIISMVSRIAGLCFSLFFTFNINAQNFSTLCKLPSVLHESSGLEYLPNGLIVSHNDGGNKPEIYLLDSLCQIIKTITIKKFPNNDWEDISVDEKGTLYIGDFGNNNQNRKDLRIGIVKDFQSQVSDTVSPEIINFNFEDQQQFPPPQSEAVFDCEAMALYNDSIYLITKNWSNPFNGFAKLYVIPSKSGTYKAKLVDSVSLGVFKEIAWITGMDIRKNEMILVGSAFAWWFGFDKAPRFDTLKARFDISPISQKEAIAFKGESCLISDESTGGYGNLYTIKLNNQTNSTSFFPDEEFIRVKCDGIELLFTESKARILIINSIGKVIWNTNLVEKGVLFVPLPNGGFYWLNVVDGNGHYFSKKIFIP